MIALMKVIVVIMALVLLSVPLSIPEISASVIKAGLESNVKQVLIIIINYYY